MPTISVRSIFSATWSAICPHEYRFGLAEGSLMSLSFKAFFSCNADQTFHGDILPLLSFTSSFITPVIIPYFVDWALFSLCHVDSGVLLVILFISGDDSIMIMVTMSIYSSTVSNYHCL